MAKSGSDAGGMIFKTGLFAILAGLGFWIFSRASGDKSETPAVETTAAGIPRSAQPVPGGDLPFDPASPRSELVRHTWFTLSYSEEHEQAEWVAYALSGERLRLPWHERGGMSFMPDPAVRTESATPRDYNGSGYDRGHLCPAADMAFDTLALRETFFMSNISPQSAEFNAGVWKDIESQTRKWAKKYGLLYIVTGPLLSRPGIAQIGANQVTVPVGFFKVLYAPSENQAIGFIVPNQKTEKDPMRYAFSVDYVEKMSGIDFFPTLLTGDKATVEAEVDRAFWGK